MAFGWDPTRKFPIPRPAIRIPHPRDISILGIFDQSQNNYTVSLRLQFLCSFLWDLRHAFFILQLETDFCVLGRILTEFILWSERHVTFRIWHSQVEFSAWVEIVRNEELEENSDFWPKIFGVIFYYQKSCILEQKLKRSCFYWSKGSFQTSKVLKKDFLQN